MVKKDIADKTFMIEDLETVRAVADPLRFQLLEMLADEQQTVRDLGEKLGLAPSRLYYHVNQLEKIGLLKVVETRQVGNLLEKVYQATAARMDVARSLLDFQTEQGKESVTTIMVSTLDATREDLLRSLNARSDALERGAAPNPRNILLQRAAARLTPAQMAAFTERLHALLLEFQDDEASQSDGQPYALLLAFYPSYYYSAEEAGKGGSE